MEDLVLVHGFAGTHASWDGVRAELDAQRYRCLTPDLAAQTTTEGCVRQVLAAARGPMTLCGYSFGGRVALHAALSAPERIAGLVLLATSAGIEDPLLRRARGDADDALADRIAGDTVAAFADAWMAQPIFAGTPPDVAAAWRADLLRADPAQLAAALRGVGQGRMAPVWERLHELTMPAAVLVGSRDERYMALGERLVAALPGAEPLIVVEGAGHGLAREAPAAVARAIQGLSAP